MSSAPTDCRVPDPTDAKADGAFGGNHRAGYGDRLDRIIATARKGWTLAAGEGLVLVQEIDRLREAERILAALREPSLEIRDAVIRVLNNRSVTDTRLGEDIDEIIEAAVAAAEKEASA